jgi:hypothetical protein
MGQRGNSRLPLHVGRGWLWWSIRARSQIPAGAGGGELQHLAALHINVREMFMVATSGLTFGHSWSGKLVIFHRENLSKNKEIMHLIRVLHYAAALHGFACGCGLFCCFKSPFYARK